jgi:hypothetical protein
MIDLSHFTKEQLNDIEQQIQVFKDRAVDSPDELIDYKVTFYVRFNKFKQRNTSLKDEISFSEWVEDEISENFAETFDLEYPEDCTHILVELATPEESLCF